MLMVVVEEGVCLFFVCYCRRVYSLVACLSCCFVDHLVLLLLLLFFLDLLFTSFACSCEESESLLVKSMSDGDCRLSLPLLDCRACSVL